jgi:monofunctional biosynthetic peptidoglycan transglycosylase
MKKLFFLCFAMTSSFIQSQNIDIVNTKKDIGTDYWRIVNDDVMGGVSRSALTLDSSNDILFKGYVSMENNGGFASCRHNFSDPKLEKTKEFKLKIKGDGKIYQFRVGTSKSYASYCYDFQTAKDKWIEIEIPTEKLIPKIRGQYVPNAPSFDPKYIREIGLLIAEKQEGKFALLLEYIKAVK